MNEILIRLIRLNSLFLKFVLFVSLDVQKNFHHRKQKSQKNDFMNEILIRLIRLNSLFLKFV